MTQNKARYLWALGRRGGVAGWRSRSTSEHSRALGALHLEGHLVRRRRLRPAAAGTAWKPRASRLLTLKWRRVRCSWKPVLKTCRPGALTSWHWAQGPGYLETVGPSPGSRVTPASRLSLPGPALCPSPTSAKVCPCDHLLWARVAVGAAGHSLPAWTQQAERPLGGPVLCWQLPVLAPPTTHPFACPLSPPALSSQHAANCPPCSNKLGIPPPGPQPGAVANGGSLLGAPALGFTDHSFPACVRPRRASLRKGRGEPGGVLLRPTPPRRAGPLMVPVAFPLCA